MMSLPDFETKYNGKAIDFDGYYGDQCVDLINQYCVDVLNISNPISELPGATAYAIYQNYKGVQFQKIANTPDGVPQAGDIIFFDTTIDASGHTSVFLHGDVEGIVSFDQNWNSHSYCEEITHTYNGVAGWLRFKETIPSTSISVDSATFSTLVGKSTKYDAFVAGGYDSIDKVQADITNKQATITNLNATISDKNSSIATLQGQIISLTAQVASLTDQLATANAQAIKVPNLVEQLSHANASLVAAQENNATAQRAIAQYKAQLLVGKPQTFSDKLKFLFS